MAFFNWAAPLMHRYLDDRWRPEDIADLTASIGPYIWGRPGSARGRLLDLGGGTGGLARRLADSLQVDVVIVDPTPEMIARVPEHPLVTAQLGSAEAIPHPDGYFDAAVVSDALHHFRDPAAALDEIRRVVRPGGGITVLEFDVQGWRRILAMVERLVGEPAHFFSPEELRALMAQHGIAGDSHRRGEWAYVFQGEVESPADG